MNDFIHYGRQWIDEDDIEAVVEALRSDWLTTGPRVEAFEEAFAAAVGARYAVAVSSGTAALHLACLAAGIGPGSEAITSPITFVATANAPLYCGSQPVFADVCGDTVNLDPEQAQARLTFRTSALLPVHFGGHACDMPVLRAIADRHGLAVIEDACHALGAQTPEGIVGDCRYSDMTVFSMHPVKAIATGEGGMITTNRPALNDRLRLLRSHGITRAPERLTCEEGGWYYEMQALGYNYRLSDIQCALGHSQLKKLATFITRRREIAARYTAAFADLPDLRLPVERAGHRSAWHLYVVRFPGIQAGARRWVFDRLRAANLGVNVHYIPVYRQPYYRDNFPFPPGLCPNAERYYREAITLPLYPGMTDAQVEYVIATVRRVALELQETLARAA
ncbi:MAG TPA: UDP-4-amino-4,6-dideoxy-N-acetyl-beta-L-altrosamine transaminase [Chthonomonadaceae bacterium]|nr:UDP-4-amino-4,6-dideoxy-N-acetyl-beta-L-altrosamine transaminase [Chthonomonadaceae bacterium]